jgi:hypothetical protein
VGELRTAVSSSGGGGAAAGGAAATRAEMQQLREQIHIIRGALEQLLQAGAAAAAQ